MAGPLLPNDPVTLRAVKALADYFKADPRGILAIWNSESGLQYRLGPVSGYYGLIMAMPSMVDGVLGGRSWANIVRNGTVLEQIAAIKQIWDSSAKNFLKESVAARAHKLGVRGDTVLYSLNFVPAYFAKMTSAKQPMVISAAYAQKSGIRSPDNGVFYRDNQGFDLDGKGYISVLDVQKRIDRKMNEGSANAGTASLFKGVSELIPFRGILGALGSAGVGAIIGSAVPGVGTALGAGLGAAIYGAHTLAKRYV